MDTPYLAFVGAFNGIYTNPLLASFSTRDADLPGGGDWDWGDVALPPLPVPAAGFPNTPSPEFPFVLALALDCFLPYLTDATGEAAPTAANLPEAIGVSFTFSAFDGSTPRSFADTPVAGATMTLSYSGFEIYASGPGASGVLARATTPALVVDSGGLSVVISEGLEFAALVVPASSTGGLLQIAVRGSCVMNSPSGGGGGSQPPSTVQIGAGDAGALVR